MATNYPSGTDSYTEPSLPEETTLSSAGSGTRNHVEHHRDLGDAVEAIEVNASKKTHNHDGANTTVGGPKLLQANTHESPDTDSATTALHHTLGVGATQAAPGNHSHGPGGPWFLCTSLTRPGSPTVGMMIYETDTHRTRIWEQFPPAVSPNWRLLPFSTVPLVRLRKGVNQGIASIGSIVEWQTEDEDTFGYFNAGTSLTSITVTEPGLYEFYVFIKTPFPLTDSTLTLMVNNVATGMQERINPNSGVTVTYLFLKCRYRLIANDAVSIKITTNQNVGTDAPQSILVDSLFDMTYVYP